MSTIMDPQLLDDIYNKYITMPIDSSLSPAPDNRVGSDVAQGTCEGQLSSEVWSYDEQCTNKDGDYNPDDFLNPDDTLWAQDGLQSPITSNATPELTSYFSPVDPDFEWPSEAMPHGTDVLAQSLQTTQAFFDGSPSSTNQATPLASSSTPSLTDSPAVGVSANNAIVQPTPLVEESLYNFAVPSGTISPPSQHPAQHLACDDHGEQLPLLYQAADCAMVQTAPLFDPRVGVSVGHENQRPVSRTEAFYTPIVPSQATPPLQVINSAQSPTPQPTLSCQDGEVQLPMIDQGSSFASSFTGSFSMLPSAVSASGHNAIVQPARCPEAVSENPAFPSHAIPQYLSNPSQYPTQGSYVEQFPQVNQASGSAAASVAPALDAHAGAGSSDYHQVQQPTWQFHECSQPDNNLAISPLANLHLLPTSLQSPTETIPRYPETSGAQYPMHAPINPPTDTQDYIGTIPPHLVVPSMGYPAAHQPYPFTNMINHPHLYPQPAAPYHIPPNVSPAPSGPHPQMLMTPAGHIHVDNMAISNGPIQLSRGRSRIPRTRANPYQSAHAAHTAAVNQANGQVIKRSGEGIPVDNYTLDKVRCGWNGCQALIGIDKRDWTGHFYEARHFERNTVGPIQCRVGGCTKTLDRSSMVDHVMCCHHGKKYRCTKRGCGRWVAGGKHGVKRHMTDFHSGAVMDVDETLVDWK